jgi:HTH-type transcriptional regulator/antitoxin HigA
MTDPFKRDAFTPDWTFHPGAVLKEVLDQRNLRQSELAERTGISAKHLNQIVNESIGITGDVAVRLERALNIPAHFWTYADADYQAFASTQKFKTELTQYISWVDGFDRTTLLRNGIIDDDDDGVTRVEKVLRLFEVASPDAFDKSWMRPRVSFRRSQAFTVAEQNTALWLRLVERSAERVSARTLNMRELKKVCRALPALTNMSITDGFVAARAALIHAGVILTFVREVPDTRMNAATWWLSAERPVVGVTERHRRPDIFWFNIVHELGHIVRHPRRTTFVNIDLDKSRGDSAEEEADEFAVETLFPGSAQSLIANAKTRRDLVLLAAELGIGVSSVAGRFARITREWKLASPLRGKITDADVTKLERIVATSDL